MTVGKPRVRKRGDEPREFVGFKCPEGLIAMAASLGRTRSEGLVRMLDAYADVRRELGEQWVEVEILAYREKITEGEALARLAAEALKKRAR